MSDAMFWVPEPKTFLELHSKTLLKHFFHREHKNQLSTRTLCQVRGTLLMRGPCGLAQKMAQGLEFQIWPKIAQLLVLLYLCVAASENICIASPAHGSTTRLAFWQNTLKQIESTRLNVLRRYSRVWTFNNWQVALRDIGFGWQPRALDPDLKSLLKIQIEKQFSKSNSSF